MFNQCLAISSQSQRRLRPRVRQDGSGTARHIRLPDAQSVRNACEQRSGKRRGREPARSNAGQNPILSKSGRKASMVADPGADLRLAYLERISSGSVSRSSGSASYVILSVIIGATTALMPASGQAFAIAEIPSIEGSGNSADRS